MDKYITKNGRKLRCGYTTGACAAAAAKAAAYMLFNQKSIDSITIDTPADGELDLRIHDVRFDTVSASCCVIKDSGDDPDVTNGMKIYAKVVESEGSDVVVIGGTGIGIVTQKGLQVDVGKHAINPGPMKMIIDEVKKVKPTDNGISVEISAPGGELIAKKTLNEKLGIAGGISVLGTTGILEPMSNRALKDSLALELSVAREAGYETVILVPGNYAKQFVLERFNIEEGPLIKVSNYIGFMLDEAVARGIKQVVLVGSIGKLIKLVGGIFNTHSNVADARLEIMAAHYGRFTDNIEDVRKILGATTTEEAVEYVHDNAFYASIVDMIHENCQQRVDDKIAVEVLLFSLNKGMLGYTAKAHELLKLYERQ